MRLEPNYHRPRMHFAGDHSLNAARSEAQEDISINSTQLNAKLRDTPTETTSNSNIYDLAKTPIKISILKQYLTSYDRTEAEFLLNGFTYGFPIQYTGPRLPRDAKNLRSATLNPELIKSKIKKEIEAGRVGGPFHERPLPNLIVSPIGLVPKKAPGEYRMIHHLSYPQGQSVNDFIDQQVCTVQYTSFDEAVKMVQELGQNCKLFKTDIRNAYRLIPIQPSDFELLGFYFEQMYYFDKALPFGASISCITFERFARFLEFCVRQKLKSYSLPRRFFRG